MQAENKTKKKFCFFFFWWFVIKLKLLASFYYHDTRNSIILRCNSALFLNTGTKNGPKPDSLMKYENRYRELLLFKQNLYCLCGFIKSYCTVIGKFNFVGKQTRNTDKRIEVTEKPKVFMGIKIITPIKDVAICVKHSTFQVNDFETIGFFFKYFMSFNMLDRQRELLVYRLRLFISSFFERTYIYYVFFLSLWT